MNSQRVSPLVRRFHQVLVEEILAHRPSYLREPFTVAEIYQDLVPYRSHRDSIGLEMAGDYEDTLLRLLAGEGGYLILESEAARKQIASELKSPDPNPAVVRRFAAAEVKLNPERVEGLGPSIALGEGPQSALDLESAIPLSRGDSAPESVAEESAEAAPLKVQSAASKVEAPPSPAGRVAPRLALQHCPWCQVELPAREDLRFCPQCGRQVTSVACESCGADVEAGWRFCIACGTERD